MKLFKNITIGGNSRYYGWFFKYKNNDYMHIFEGITSENQITIIKDMIKTMKKLRGRLDGNICQKKLKKRLKLKVKP